MFFRLNHSRNQCAFTLVELIVSMLLFTIFIGVVTSTYLSVSRSLRQSAEIRQVYGQARFVMDRFTQDVRLNTIDYACFEDLSDNGVYDYQTDSNLECVNANLSSEGETSVLALISSDGSHRTVYAFDETEGLSVLELDWDETFGAWVASSGYAEGAQVFQFEGAELASVQFVVKPLSSPYDSDHYIDAATQYQPSVHVMILARSTSSILEEAVQVRLQSTLSSRVYAVTF